MARRANMLEQDRKDQEILAAQLQYENNGARVIQKPVLDENNKIVHKGIVKGISSEVQSKPGRNDMCPCRSGKKYKKCCGA